MNTPYQHVLEAQAFSKYECVWITLYFNEPAVIHMPCTHTADVSYFVCEIIYFINRANTVEGRVHFYERKAMTLHVELPEGYQDGTVWQKRNNFFLWAEECYQPSYLNKLPQEQG